MRGALEVHRDLLSREIPHEVVHLRRRAVDADDLPAAGGLPPGATVAVRMVGLESRRAGPLLAAACVPAGAGLSVPGLLAALRHLGVTAARLPTASEVSAVTDQAAGLVCPVGLPASVPLVVDEALVREPVVYTPTGEGATALGIRVPDLLAVTGARTALLTAVLEASPA